MRRPVYLILKVRMIAGRHPGTPDIADHIPAAHIIPDLERAERGHMRVHGGNSAAMINDDVMPECPHVRQSQQHNAIHRAVNWSAASRREVYACMYRIRREIFKAKFACDSPSAGGKRHDRRAAKEVPRVFQRGQRLPDNVMRTAAGERTGAAASQPPIGRPSASPKNTLML